MKLSENADMLQKMVLDCGNAAGGGQSVDSHVARVGQTAGMLQVIFRDSVHTPPSQLTAFSTFNAKRKIAKCVKTNLQQSDLFLLRPLKNLVQPLLSYLK